MDELRKALNRLGDKTRMVMVYFMGHTKMVCIINYVNLQNLSKLFIIIHQCKVVLSEICSLQASSLFFVRFIIQILAVCGMFIM